jgi:hypothetical protein
VRQSRSLGSARGAARKGGPYRDPDFCEAADPESKEIVEHLVGYAKRDLMIPAQLDLGDLTAANAAAAAFGVADGAPQPVGIFKIWVASDRSAWSRTAWAVAGRLCAGSIAGANPTSATGSKSLRSRSSMTRHGLVGKLRGASPREVADAAGQRLD